MWFDNDEVKMVGTKEFFYLTENGKRASNLLTDYSYLFVDRLQ